jgi:hypothetical protein
VQAVSTARRDIGESGAASPSARQMERGYEQHFV